MKKVLLIIAVIWTGCTTVNAQSKASEHHIAVTGKSEISIKPDEAIINVRLKNKAMKASDASAMLNKKTNEIEAQLKNSKVKDYELTTSNYTVNVNRIYTKGTSKDSGYVASQNLKVTLSNPLEDLVKVVEVLNKNEKIMFDVNFSISEKMAEKYEAQLLEEALHDAREKAELIASTMSLDHLSVASINYSSNTPITFPRPVQMQYMRVEKSMAADQEPSFSPEEQKLTDEVNVIFSFGD
ncbi:SIMPL domain-containing protein [Echinicola strongylocentroti]|uniref:SIMPL domain-containing protein n=1 Tax=Echinicola strongylocentroti TaxID=1795355 RepID=A0A2Z4ILU4_9BACT|nr:SIMPL domain-containing protein [Echinicola strongylocentroti]AWW31687.1 SIMPL domain-containing protein [Echinicola strongylocentroti]